MPGFLLLNYFPESLSGHQTDDRQDSTLADRWIGKILKSFDLILSSFILTTIMRKLSLLLVFPLFLLASCRTEDNPTGSGTNTTPGPKTGSSFTYDYQVRGSENQILDEGTTTQTLVKTNASAYGKSKVWIYVDADNDSSFYAIESNGNVSTYIDAESAATVGLGQAFWIMFPTSGTGGENRVIAQEQIEYQGVPATLRARLTSEFEQNESITIGTKVYPVKQAGALIKLDVIVGGQVVNSGDLMKGSIFWVPELNASAGAEQLVQLENTMFYVEELSSLNLK